VRKLAQLLLAAVALLLGACATKPIDYYYGNYEQAYYHNKKDNTPAATAKYQKALEDIIKTSEKRGIRVPPGIYCEYGYLLAKQGNANAGRYFDLEVQTYPESAKFVALLKSQITKQ